MVCPRLMDLLVHASTSGHLLVACSLEFIPEGLDTYRHTMATPTFHLLCRWWLLLWEYTQTMSNWQPYFRNYQNDLLWDGQVCEDGGSYCLFSNPPWFTKSLASPTTDRIELRLCLHHLSRFSDIALELLELYIQWLLVPVTTYASVQEPLTVWCLLDGVLRH